MQRYLHLRAMHSLHTHPRPKLHAVDGSMLLRLRSFPPQILRCLAAVAAVAKALQVVRIAEEFKVSFVVHDVVYVCRLDPQAMLGAFPAPGLPQKLCRPELFGPQVCGIQLVPLSCLSAPIIPAHRLVLVTVPIGHQDMASWMPARS